MTQKESIGISRRRFLTPAGVSVGATLLVRRTLFAEGDGMVPTMVNAAAKAKISVSPIRRNISVLEGSGGNIAVLTGRDGKLLVEAGFSVSRPAITDALASINSDPIQHLINTHWHTDHTDGNACLHSAGAAITAHENTRKRLSVDAPVEGWNWTFPAAPAGALPTTVFAIDREMRRNDTKLVLKYYGPAHTDSDISVNFTEADVVHVGDTWWNGVYPFIDYSTGGSIDGSIRAAEANVAAFTAKTIIIPGHGPVGGRSDIAEFRDMLVTIRENVAALKKQGQSLGDTVAAKRRVRREMGTLPNHPSRVHGARFRGRLIVRGQSYWMSRLLIRFDQIGDQSQGFIRWHSWRSLDWLPSCRGWPERCARTSAVLSSDSN